MKIIYNYFLPTKGFVAIMLFGVIFARKEFKPLSKYTINHERIHQMQAKKAGGYFRFYLKYLRLWLKHGYKNNPYEVEARHHEYDLNYMTN